jgi:hypothetical protein
LIYGIAFSVLTAAVAALFIVQVLTVYNSGAEQLFTREIVEKKLLEILAPCILWIVAVIGGIVLWNIHPDEEEKLRAVKDSKATLKGLQSRLPDELSQDSQAWVAESNKWGNYRLLAWLAYAAVCVAGVIVCALYLTNPTRFTANDINGEVTAAVLMVLPWIIGAFVCALCVSAFENYALQQQLALVKKTIAANAKNLKKPAQEKALLSENKKVTAAVRIGLLAVGVALFVIGMFNGGLNDVLIKAINICTECIGLG